MQIFLKTIALKNFKGIADVTFNFDKRETFIHAKNGVGKTSLNDADLWCKFGKDHENRADYQLKRFDQKGEIVHRVDSEVELLYLIDGKELKLKRMFHENWVKPRTKTEEVLDGNSTIYYIDDCEVKKSDYDAKIASLCDSEVFKAITNPNYFPNLSKDGQRAILFAMVGDISDEEIAGGNEEFRQLLADVTGKGFLNFRSELRSKISKLKSELEDIDPRIDELNRNKPEMPNIAEIEKLIEEKSAKVDEIDGAISNIAERSKQDNSRRLDIQRKINELNQANQQLGFEEQSNAQKESFSLQTRFTELKRKADTLRTSQLNRKRQIEELNSEKSELLEKLSKLRIEWKEITDEKLVIPENAFECPTCKRTLDVEDIESKQAQMTENFNKQKAEKIRQNNEKGQKHSTRVKEIDSEIVKLSDIGAQEQVNETEIENLEKQFRDLEGRKPEYQSKPEYLENEKKISALKEELNKGIDIEDTIELTKSRKQMEEEINGLRSKIALKDVIKNTETRITQLKEMKKSANQELANLEKKEYALKNFEFAKNTEYQARINRMFRFTKFRLFHQQMDGQIVPDFECMVNGVPYGTLNDAGKMAAGLDIIYAMSKHYDTYAPIWIDNRESVTDIPEMESQVINLVVDPSYDKLTFVEHFQSASPLLFPDLINN